MATQTPMVFHPGLRHPQTISIFCCWAAQLKNLQEPAHQISGAMLLNTTINSLISKPLFLARSCIPSFPLRTTNYKALLVCHLAYLFIYSNTPQFNICVTCSPSTPLVIFFLISIVALRRLSQVIQLHSRDTSLISLLQIFTDQIMVQYRRCCINCRKWGVLYAWVPKCIDNLW